MKLVHVIICAAYREGWGYQENILPLKHKELGYDVSIITRIQDNDITNKVPRSYMSKGDIPVYVLAPRPQLWIDKVPKLRAFPGVFLNRTVGLYEKLSELKPDIIFVHGIVARDHLGVVRYVSEHPQVRLYADNHSDYYNSPVNTVSGWLFKRLWGSHIAKKLSRYARVMWGVTPWRVKYLEDVYRVPEEKVDLLVMGGDEDKIDFVHKDMIRAKIRSKYGIPDDAFLIVSGGKIDRPKNIHLLIETVRNLEDKGVFLLIFGKYENDMSEYEALDCKNIRNAGWIPAEKSYDLFLSSDLAVFPGTHSVLWEQACASGIPAIFKDWDGGFSHVDVGGNCILLREISVVSLQNCIIQLLNDAKKYSMMKEIAQNRAAKEFSYIEIAKRAVEFDGFEGRAM